MYVTATKIPFIYSFSWNCANSVPISTFSNLYIPTIGPHISLQQNRQAYPGNIEISHRYMSIGTGRQNIIILFWK